MSHSLGPLADNLAAYAIYATAQSEMRHAYALIESGDYLAAAEEIASAAHAARVLATASAPVDASRAAHWNRVVAARTQFAEQVRERAALDAYERAAARSEDTRDRFVRQERFADQARERAVLRSLAA